MLARIAVFSDGQDITLDYAVDGVRVTERIGITRTACHYGHTRPWFTCPKCAGRVALLYLYGERFACRKCHGLVYRSQSEDPTGRLWRKQQKLEAKLGPHLARPKGMRHKTRDAILAKVWQCVQTREDEVAAYCERVGITF